MQNLGKKKSRWKMESGAGGVNMESSIEVFLNNDESKKSV